MLEVRDGNLKRIIDFRVMGVDNLAARLIDMELNVKLYISRVHKILTVTCYSAR